MAGLSNNLIDSLRNYLLDLEELNQLNLEELELKDSILEEAVYEGVHAYDLIPPLSTIDIIKVDISSKEWFLIKQLAALQAIQRLVFLHVRNRNPSNDQGFQVDEFNKASEWLRVRANIMSELRPTIITYKRILDFQSFQGSSVSLAP